MTLKDLEIILGRRSQDSSYNAQKISEEYKVKLQDAEMLLRYYGVYTVVDNRLKKPDVLSDPLQAQPDWEEVKHEPLQPTNVKQIGPSK